MTRAIVGACHCGNLSYELVTAAEPVEARACDCSFCRIHAAINWSDPNGSLTIRIADERDLQKYRFGLGTADFFICRTCGAYLGAVLADLDGAWSTVNLRLSALVVGARAASYGDESSAERIARRKRVWTPTRVEIGFRQRLE